jgi:hypothetical protein
MYAKDDSIAICLQLSPMNEVFVVAVLSKILWQLIVELSVVGVELVRPNKCDCYFLNTRSIFQLNKIYKG